MRGLNNYTAKCNVKKTRKGIARRKTSRILQREQPRYRGARESMNTPVYKTENLIQKSLQMRKARRNNK